MVIDHGLLLKLLIMLEAADMKIHQPFIRQRFCTQNQREQMVNN